MYILIAGVLSILLGIVHSFLGEFLIFKNKRKKGSIIPSTSSDTLKERHLRIIWATWHLATFFGSCIGVVLIKMAFQEQTVFMIFILQSITYTMFAAALLVLLGTKGKHPGWIVLLAIGILLVLAN